MVTPWRLDSQPSRTGANAPVLSRLFRPDRGAHRFLAFFGACTFGSSLAARLPLIGSSISRWPEIACAAFCPCFLGRGGFRAGRLVVRWRGCASNASIRLMTLPLDSAVAFAVMLMPLRSCWMRSIKRDS